MMVEICVRVTVIDVDGDVVAEKLLERRARVNAGGDPWGMEKQRLEDAADSEIDGLLDVVKEYLR